MIRKIITINIIIFLFVSNIYTIEEITNASEEYIEQTYIKALEKYKMQKYEASLDDIRHVIKSNMQNYKLRYLAAHNHWRLGNYESAILHFNESILINKNEAGPYIDLSLLYLQNKNYKNSEKLALACQNNLETNNIEIPSKLFNILSRLNLYKGKYQEALDYAQEAKAAFNRNKAGIKDKLEAITLEARALLALKNFEKAELAAIWAIKLKEDNPYAYGLLGYIYETWAKETSSDEEKKDYLNKAKENYEICINLPNVSENLFSTIKNNLTRIN
ncbi:MAG: tetratricopeptide repeat protein [Spirochaetia bacterium]|nr:tetratricopeptide repeat protein [Spirochaetia bacterium]